MNNMGTEASAAFRKWHATTKQDLCQRRRKTDLKKHVASQHVVTCFSKATVTRPDNRERGIRTGRDTAYTGPHHLRSSLLNSQM